MNEQQWDEIKIEDVKPGDVARCNGREFPVVEDGGCTLCDVHTGGRYLLSWYGFSSLGFTFWRKVKREPRAFTGTLTGCLPFSHSIEVTLDIPPSREWPIEQGARLRVEILDGEDGA